MLNKSGLPEPFGEKVWLSSPTMHGEELEYMRSAYETNWMSTVGENVDEVERLSAKACGRAHGVALSCGTAALHLAVKLAGVRPGDEVLCSDVTFAATVNPVVYEGGRSDLRGHRAGHLEHGPRGAGESFRAAPGRQGRHGGPPLRHAREDGRDGRDCPRPRRRRYRGRRRGSGRDLQGAPRRLARGHLGDLLQRQQDR